MKDVTLDKRLRIGIVFNFSPNWMGGIIYILNLVKILDFLDEEEKPEIILFYRSDLRKYVDEINYPYLKAVIWRFSPIYKGYMKSWLLQKNTFINEILLHFDLDGLYPIQDFPVKTETGTKLVSWYADLQHKYYPEFFTWKKVFERNTRIKFMLKNSCDLVVSSQVAANDFKKFFRISQTMRIHVFHFSSVIDNSGDLHIDLLLNRYKLPSRYFMISNQFHKHKNHKVVLEALVKLKEKRPDAHLVITGRFPEATQSPYMQELHSIINDHNLQSHLSLLGIIPRNEQLLIMKHAQAVLQPSLFEGWSTVIEDAISLQVPVIASSLPVNIEQLGPDGNYFDPHDANKLTEILCNFPVRNMSDIFYENYDQRIRKAAKIFIEIFKS